MADLIAQTIRTVDGNHALGAGALGEHIASALVAAGFSRDTGGDEHIRNTLTDNGPGWCLGCSEAAQEYVEWPCSRARLVEAVRANEALYRSYETAGDTGEGETTVEWGVRDPNGRINGPWSEEIARTDVAAEPEYGAVAGGPRR